MGSVSTQSVTMKSFILASLFTTCLSAPTATPVASGDPAGPLTLAFGDAVHTPKGLRSYSLEGFSEDLDQDGFVDPIGQAVVVAPAVAPVTYTVPKVVTVPKVAAVPAPAPVTYTVPKLTVPAPVTYTVPKLTVPAPVTSTVPVPAVSDKDTVVPAATAPLIYSSVPVVPSVINYSGVKAEYASDPLVGKLQYLPGFAPFTGVPFLGGLVPAAAAAAPAVEAAAPAVEAAGEGVEAV